MTTKSLLSALTIAAVGLGSKAFLNLLCADVAVAGLPRLLAALDRPGRRGVLTVSNHISVADDPLAWGVLPAAHYARARPMRWALGAADICFTNPLFAAFFRRGQVLETVRGGGVRQPAIERAIALLNAGEWLHVFPEGRVAQPPHADLGRLKWGIGRILMHVDELPTIIPMWLTGFDQVMHEARGFPRLLPRPGKRVGVTFGAPEGVERRTRALLARRAPGWRSGNGEGAAEAEAEAEMRAAITRVVQDELARLGARVSGEVGDDDVHVAKEHRD